MRQPGRLKRVIEVLERPIPLPPIRAIVRAVYRNIIEDERYIRAVVLSQRAARCVAGRFVREDRRWALWGFLLSVLVAISTLVASVYSWHYPYQSDEYTTFFCYGYLAINNGPMSWGYDGSPLSDFAVDFPTVFFSSLMWVGAFAALSARELRDRGRRVIWALRLTGACWGIVLAGWLLLPMHKIGVRDFPWKGFTTHVGQGEIIRYDTSCSHCRPDSAFHFSSNSRFRWTPKVWHIEAGQGGFGVYYMKQPMWIPALLMGIPVYLLMHVLRRIPNHYCFRCLYDLTGNQSGICPECGTTVQNAAPAILGDRLMRAMSRLPSIRALKP